MKISVKALCSCSIVIALIFSSCVYGGGQLVSPVYAASKNTILAKSHISHLYNSLHNNYLGIKNQGQWQSYIKKIRGIIASIPSSEKSEKDKFTAMVNSAEALVNGVSRINQVEKSIASNTPRMGNVRQWDFYLALGDQDLSKVDMEEFSAEVQKLEARLSDCYDKVNQVAMAYDGEYVNVLEVYNKAEASQSIDDAKAAYELALKLPSCEETSVMIFDCKTLLVKLGAITISNDEADVNKGYYKLQDVLLNAGIEVDDTSPTLIAAAIKGVVGSDIGVSAVRVFYNPDTGEEVFDIVLSKGGFKLFPIGVYFR